MSSWCSGCSISSRSKASSSASRAGVGQGVGRVRVHLQGEIGPALAHGPHDRHVPARLDLELDAAIAGRHVALDLEQQFVQSRLDAHADAHGHPIAHAAQHLCQRQPLRPAQQVPDCVLQAGAGHGVAAYAFEALDHVGRLTDFPCPAEPAPGNRAARARRSRWSRRSTTGRPWRRTRPSR
jgi:hypothetical protein